MDKKDLLIVFNKIDELIQNPTPVYLAIEGRSGAGKTSLAKLIGSRYDCNIFHMDDFFLRPGQKTLERLAEVGGNIDYERFTQEVIQGLKSNAEFKYQRYSCRTLKLEKAQLVVPKKLNIIEGVYSMHPNFKDIYDLKIFLDVDEKTQLERIANRSGKALLARFIKEWIPKENEYFQELKIKEKSDIILRLP